MDVCLCSTNNCTRDCARNTNNYDLRGKIYTVTVFEKADDFKDYDTCPYYLERSNYGSKSLFGV